MSKITKILGLNLIFAVIASPALAQEVPEHGVFILNSLLFLMAGFLVMFMACGFCMLEAGLVRSKNTTMQLTKNISLFFSCCYWLLHYWIQFNVPAW